MERQPVMHVGGGCGRGIARRRLAAHFSPRRLIRIERAQTGDGAFDVRGQRQRQRRIADDMAGVAQDAGNLDRAGNAVAHRIATVPSPGSLCKA